MVENKNRMNLAAKAFALLLPLAWSANAQAAAAQYFSVPGADAPQLAKRGAYAVGVRTLQIVHPNQVDILHFDKSTGKAPLYDRPLTVEVWYPATIPAGQEEKTTYVSAMPNADDMSETFQIAGKALRDAPPLAGTRFPLVVVSHGYPGSRTFLVWLTENLASKGYVVAAIDHTDSVFGAVRPFPSTLLNRSRDQLFTIEALGRLSQQPGSFLRGLLDAGNVAIVGYSMGGYGALTSAGAGYSKTSALNGFVPGGYLHELLVGDPAFSTVDRSAIKAVVAIAPWGKQPPYSAWDAEGLANIRIPALFIAGDHDDVADYANGIRPAFDQAINSERYLLVYDEARHNTGGNPPPPDVLLTYRELESFDEPVWRKDRITAINQHFITAFLDLYLKGDQSHGAFLNIPLAKSDAGRWKADPNTPDNGAFSAGKDPQGEDFWPGFQRRWALGLEWVHLAAGQQAR